MTRVRSLRDNVGMIWYCLATCWRESPSFVYVAIHNEFTRNREAAEMAFRRCSAAAE